MSLVPESRASSSATTIVAIASPPGPGERGVVRVSGALSSLLARATWRAHHSRRGEAAPNIDHSDIYSRDVSSSDLDLRHTPYTSLQSLSPSSPDWSPSPSTSLDLSRRSLHIGRFFDGRGTQPLLLLWMPAPHSFTREDVAEFHLPGSPPLLTAALAHLLSLGATLAQPGEFTRRAFSAGRIDLTRAEGVLALVHASNENEARSARALLFGGLDQRVRALRDELDTLRALCEASLDFDESDTGHVPLAELLTGLATIERGLDAALGFETQRARGTGEPRIVLVGAPNAGKSRLFNALVDEERALVSDLSGTTRDTLTARFDLAGRAVLLVDTAGFDDFARGPDREAQDLARGAHAAADVLVWVVDASLALDLRRIETLRAERDRLGRDVPIVLAWNKSDVATSASESRPDFDVARAIHVSAHTRAGLSDLHHALAASLESTTAAGGLEREVALRHQRGLTTARDEIRAARDALVGARPLELAAEHLRRATSGLDDLSGTTTPEDVLDRIFARFCLGK